MLNTKNMASRLRNDLTRLIYRFDFQNPWQNFTHGAPRNSSVEKGRRKKDYKLQKIYLRKINKPLRRKNGAYGQIASINLVCCEQGCLLKLRIPVAQELIRQERAKVYSHGYDDQNHLFSKLIKISLCASGRRQIRYKIPSIGDVCKRAFMKCYGISKRKIKVLTQKIDENGLCVEGDKRGKHQNCARKLLPEARRKVIDYITSHNATESHYRRSRTNMKYFESSTTMRQMWVEFVRRNPELRTTRSRHKNKGPVISYSCFRNIFYQDLRKSLSFRKPRVDTCQTCDQTKKKIDSASGLEKQQLMIKKLTHLRESEARYASMKYDIEVMSTKKTRSTGN